MVKKKEKGVKWKWESRGGKKSNEEGGGVPERGVGRVFGRRGVKPGTAGRRKARGGGKSWYRGIKVVKEKKKKAEVNRLGVVMSEGRRPRGEKIEGPDSFRSSVGGYKKKGRKGKVGYKQLLPERERKPRGVSCVETRLGTRNRGTKVLWKELASESGRKEGERKGGDTLTEGKGGEKETHPRRWKAAPPVTQREKASSRKLLREREGGIWRGKWDH